MRLLHIIHSGFTWLTVMVLTAVCGPIAAVLGNLAPHSSAALAVARGWARLGLLAAGSRLSVEGRDQVDSSRRYVIMCNHESSLDIPTLLVAVPPALCLSFLAKKSLFSVPFLGRAMGALGFIPVDREDTSTAKGMFEQTLAAIAAGRSPLIFPESTRSKDGRLLPFKRGGFLLALKSGLPILPIGLEGPRVAMPDGSILLRPGHIVVRFGCPIDPTAYGVARREQLTADTRAVIDRLRGDRGHVHDGSDE